MQDIEQIARRFRQPVRPGDNEGVAFCRAAWTYPAQGSDSDLNVAPASPSPFSKKVRQALATIPDFGGTACSPPTTTNPTGRTGRGDSWLNIRLRRFPTIPQLPIGQARPAAATGGRGLGVGTQRSAISLRMSVAAR
jgi:hypothetical protein